MMRRLEAQRKERIFKKAGYSNRGGKANEVSKDLATGAAHRLLRANQYKPPLGP